MLDLLKFLGPVAATILAATASALKALAARADAVEARAQARYDALLAELREAARAREAFHAAESERQRADAKAMGESLALCADALRRSTAIIEAIEPRLGAGPSVSDPETGRRKTR